ncbi:MAG: c-type cytochrome [Desulfovermiculus sp.]|nr:c-type cytochrome [Desulfovermiculus sp.]
MRKTTLHQTTLVVAVIILVVSIIFGIMRNNIAPHASHEHDHGHAGQAEPGVTPFQDQGCSQCHFTDSKNTKIGPGLKGLFDRTNLPVSGGPVTEEQVRNQLMEPYADMPSFADRLNQQEIENIISYLKTL